MNNINCIFRDENLAIFLLDLRDGNTLSGEKGLKQKLHAKAKEQLLKEVLSVDEAMLSHNEFGKPYIKDGGKFFSISHDDGVTVVGVSDKEIGIDIEKICEVKWPVINRLFPIDYKNRVKEAGASENLEFIKCWTSIEAVLKARGTGFIETGINSEKLDFMYRYEIGHILYEDFVIAFAYEK